MGYTAFLDLMRQARDSAPVAPYMLLHPDTAKAMGLTPEPSGIAWWWAHVAPGERRYRKGVQRRRRAA